MSVGGRSLYKPRICRGEKQLSVASGLDLGSSTWCVHLAWSGKLRKSPSVLILRLDV